MLRFLFDPRGRVSRKGYFLAFFLPFFLVTNILPSVLGGPFAMLSGFVSVFLLWPWLFVVPTKRLHDMGLSAWYAAGFMVLFILAGTMAFGSAFGQFADLGADASSAEQQEVILRTVQNDPRARTGSYLFILTFVAQLALFAAVRGQRGKNRFGGDPLRTKRGLVGR